MLGTILIILLILMLLGGLPNVGLISHSYGYYPSGALTVVLVIVIVLLLAGRL